MIDIEATLDRLVHPIPPFIMEIIKIFFPIMIFLVVLEVFLILIDWIQVKRGKNSPITQIYNYLNKKFVAFGIWFDDEK